MKVSTFSGHVSIDDSGTTVLIGEGEQFPDDAPVVLARPEFFTGDSEPDADATAQDETTAGDTAQTDTDPAPDLVPEPDADEPAVAEQVEAPKPRARRRGKA